MPSGPRVHSRALPPSAGCEKSIRAPSPNAWTGVGTYVTRRNSGCESDDLSPLPAVGLAGSDGSAADRSAADPAARSGAGVRVPVIDPVLTCRYANPSSAAGQETRTQLPSSRAT